MIPKQTAETHIKTESIQKVSKTETRNRKCFYCNAPNWTTEYICPARKSFCNKYKKKGHFAVACKSKINYINRENETAQRNNEDEDNTQTQTLHKITENTFYDKKLTVDGRQINFVVETGSPITIIPNHLKPDKPLLTVEQI